MRKCTEDDKRLQKKIPYYDNIPYVMTLGESRLQCRDVMERKEQWYGFVGFVVGYVAISQIKFGPMLTQ